MKNSEASTDEIVDVIKIDPVITSSVLRLANTIIFNISGKVSSIPDAVMRLGFKHISDLIISIVIIRNFSGQGFINYNKFWKHSLSVSFTSNIVADNASLILSRPDDCYISGLLHEIGVLALDQFFSDLYGDVLIAARDSDSELFEIEEEFLGINHAEIGAHLIEKWQLPQCISDAIYFHHKPFLAPIEYSQAAKTLHIANFICDNQGISNGIDKFPTDFSKVAWDDIGMRSEDIPKIIKAVQIETEKAEELLNIASTPTHSVC